MDIQTYILFNLQVSHVAKVKAYGWRENKHTYIPFTVVGDIYEIYFKRNPQRSCKSGWNLGILSYFNHDD